MLYLGIDIGGTKCAIVVGDEKCNIIERATFKTGRDTEPQIIIDKIIELSKELKTKHGQDNFISIGISCGGPLDSRLGIIMSPPNLPLWDNIEIVNILEKRLGLKTYIQNDANACALAEWKFGSGKGTSNMVFLTFGTGLGAGLILNGKLYEGTNGMAGEVGHIRLTDNGPIGFNKEGSFEGYCSGGGIKNLSQIVIKEKWNNNQSVSFCKDENDFEKLTAKYVFQQAKDGDSIAKEIVDICAINLGKGLSIIIDMLNPECIVIGSIYTRDEPLLRDKAIEIIKQEAISQSAQVCSIKPASLDEKIGDYACLSVAINNM